VGARNYAVTGYLAIHGVTREVTLNVKDVSEPSNDPWGISVSASPLL
jgi:polyisoprenoid-binding protein YceI